MKFLCGKCRTKYQISDEKVRGKVLTIRCKKCGAKVVVKESLAKQGTISIAPSADESVDSATGVTRIDHTQGRDSLRAAASTGPSTLGSSGLASAFDAEMGRAFDDVPTSIAPVPLNDIDAGAEWYVAIDGVQSGPLAYLEVARKLKAREVLPKHYVWRDGFDGWRRIRDVADLAQFAPPEQKKRPPPPPGMPSQFSDEANATDAKIVDFQQKRLERERRTSLESAPRQEMGSTMLATEPAASVPEGLFTAHNLAELPQSASSPDAAALVDPFALGQTAASPDRRRQAPGPSVFGSEPSDSGAGAVVFGGAAHAGDSDSFIPDNLFDAVPRASEQELVARESTRFFVAAAGVNARKSKAKLGLLLGFGGAVLFVAFVGLWAGGIIEISLPGIGNPFKRTHVAELEELDAKELTAEEVRILNELVKHGQSKAAALRQIRGKKSAPSGSYVTDKTDVGPGGTRGDAVTTVGLGNDISPSGFVKPVEAPIGAPRLNAPTIPPATTGEIPPSVIRQVISDGKGAIVACYQRELRGGSQDLSGKLEFNVTVEPNGEVSKAFVSTPKYKGTGLADCIATKIRGWKFPAFEGGPREVILPLVLQRAAN